LNDKLRDTSLAFLPAKFHNFTMSGLFFIHKNITEQFFMKHLVYVNLASVLRYNGHSESFASPYDA